MPIIGNVGRRSFKVRLLNTTIHVVLILGALTMVYPFLVMLSSSVKSAVDSRSLSAVPRYFHDEEMLYRKWIEAKYNEFTQTYSLCYRRRLYSFDRIRLPGRPVRRRYEDWNSFLDEAGDALNEFHYSLGHSYGIGTKPEMARLFVAELKAEPDILGDITRMNERYGTTFVDWDAISMPLVDLLLRDRTGSFSPFLRRFVEFSKAQLRGYFNYYSLDSFFVEQTLRPKHAQGIRQLNADLGTDFRSWEEVTLARRVPADGLRDDWIFFVKNRLNLQCIDVSELALPTYREYLREKYADVDLLNKRHGTRYSDFSDVELAREVPRAGALLVDWDCFVTTRADPEHLSIKSTEFMHRDFLEHKYGTIEELTAAHQFGLRSLDEHELTARRPAGNTAYEDDWTEFVDRVADPQCVRPDFGANRQWVAFLTEPYRDGQGVDLAALNADLGTQYHAIEDVFIPAEEPENPKLAALWRRFLREVCPRELLVVDVEAAKPKWREFIRGRYADAAELNRRYAWVPAGFDKVSLPTADVDFFNFQKVKKHAFWEFLTRNYAVVFEMMLYNGRAIVNTFIYCGLAVLAALLVNPLAAYALSRYRPPSQYKLLLLLMLTMAFPTMVLGIPNFLLLRRLGMLNTFAALILPGMANGYMIFLLKGFFDSLPREIYESAQLDGASEWTMFWQITMATSKPILAVIALQAFTAAYGNFMMAFIVCQSPKMWTMMVHIYQLQQRSSQGVSFAALVIAAIPTLLVFIFCQNIIMRGIVVPTEK